MKRTLILASSADEVAFSLAQRLSRSDVLVLAPRDLSRPGWCYRPGRADSTLVVDGEVLDSADLAGVVTRLPWISERELPHIVAADRAYVAAEIGAFVVAWLSELACSVANRPSPSCLCGPFWLHERWVAGAARAGLKVEPARRLVSSRGAEYPEASRRTHVSVTVVGEQCFGEVDDSLVEQALWLARSTAVETLTVGFSHGGSGAAFVAASPWPLLEDDAVARALLDHAATAAKPVRAVR